MSLYFFTPTDIALNIDGFMEVLVPRNSELPCEFDCEMEVEEDAVIELYEGNRVHCENNYRLVAYHLQDSKPGKFIFRIIVEEKVVRVFIDKEELEPVIRPDPTKWVEEAALHLIEDSSTRRLVDSRVDFKDYIFDTLRTINDDEVKQALGENHQILLDKLEWASQVLEVEDVTTEEFVGSLQELEKFVNPIMESIKGVLKDRVE